MVIARPPGPQPAADLRPGAFDEAALEGRVHVLVILGRDEHARLDVSAQLLECAEHRVMGGVVEQPRRMKDAGVGT